MYNAREEVDYGTLHDRVDFISLQLAELDAFAHTQTHDERWEELSCLREGLELVALAIHYDKSAWQFFHDHSWAPRLESTFPFELKHPDVQAHWQLCFHDSSRQLSDSTNALRAGVDMLTRMPSAILGPEYHKVMRKIREVVGRAWDETYRVPVSLSFDAPEVGQDPTRWLSVVYELIRSLNDLTGPVGSSLCLGPILLSVQKLPIMDFTNELLLNMMSAYAHVPRLALALEFNDAASIAPTINDAVAICPVGTQPDDRFVDTLMLRGSSGAPQFAGWCSAIARAQSLGCLSLQNAFADQTREERALQWRWLGYALSNRHWTTSVRHLKLKEETLTRDDITQLIAKHYDANDTNPPSFAMNEYARAVQLAAKSLIRLNDGENKALEVLGWTSADEFLVLNEDDDGESMVILVPGYGRCRVECTSIVDARVLETAPEKPKLLSLNLHLDRCGPEPLPVLIQHVGSMLTSLHLLMQENVVMDEVPLRNVFRQCHVLRFLSLRRVHVGSMDTILDAYRANQCRVEVLSLWTTWVEPTSLTRFAFELSDKHALLNLHLREFRFNYDDLDGDLHIPDEDGIAAFTMMLEYNRTLTFFEIALEESLHAQYSDRLLDLDGVLEIPAIPVPIRLTFLGVVTELERSSTDARRKKQRQEKPYVLPGDCRQQIVRRIWRFLSPVDSITRTVSATIIQPEDASDDS